MVNKSFKVKAQIYISVPQQVRAGSTTSVRQQRRDTCLSQDLTLRVLACAATTGSGESMSTQLIHYVEISAHRHISSASSKAAVSLFIFILKKILLCVSHSWCTMTVSACLHAHSTPSFWLTAWKQCTWGQLEYERQRKNPNSIRHFMQYMFIVRYFTRALS